jgi:hypothetical protein
MGLFKAKNPITTASKTVAAGAVPPAGDESGGIMQTLQQLWADYGTYAMLAGAALAAWYWLLPMLGLRKKRRGNPGALAKARRAKARKAGRI